MANITIVFFRHGKAVSSKEVGTDKDRWLVPEGKQDVRCVARLLPLTLPHLVSSPLRRAIESAEIISEIFNVGYHVDERLLPENFSLTTLKQLIEAIGHKEIILVGHSPSLENTLWKLLVKNEKADTSRIKLPAGAAAVIESGADLEENILRELITPRIARKVCT